MWGSFVSCAAVANRRLGLSGNPLKTLLSPRSGGFPPVPPGRLTVMAPPAAAGSAHDVSFIAIHSPKIAVRRAKPAFGKCPHFLRTIVLTSRWKSD